MRIQIDKGFQPLIRKVMVLIDTEDPRLALNHIISTWAASQSQQSPPPAAQPPTIPEDDEFSELTDWS